MKEWKFEEDSELVDINRLHSELMDTPTFVAMSYISELKKNAPRVYERYCEWVREDRKVHPHNTGCLPVLPEDFKVK